MVATDLKADLDSLLALTRPTDVYTLSEMNRTDHAPCRSRFRTPSAQRLAPTMHEALIWPEGPLRSAARSTMAEPLAGLGGRQPARALYSGAPRLPHRHSRAAQRDGHNWGSWGTPDEVDQFSRDARRQSDEPQVKVIASYASQFRCGPAATGRRRRHLGTLVPGSSRRSFSADRLRSAPCPGPAKRQLLAERPAMDFDDQRLGAGRARPWNGEQAQGDGQR